MDSFGECVVSHELTKVSREGKKFSIFFLPVYQLLESKLIHNSTSPFSFNEIHGYELNRFNKCEYKKKYGIYKSLQHYIAKEEKKN